MRKSATKVVVSPNLIAKILNKLSEIWLTEGMLWGMYATK